MEKDVLMLHSFKKSTIITGITFNNVIRIVVMAHFVCQSERWDRWGKIKEEVQ